MTSDAPAAARVAVACIGNASRGDDGAGPAVARLLARASLDDVEIVEIGGDCVSLLDVFDRARAVVIVDAVASGAPIGTVHRVDASRPLPFTLAGPSSHALGVAETIELGRVLGRLPARVVIVGIEARAFEHGGKMSPEMDRAIRAAADVVKCELASLARE
jgi:hydrogenase maturation protease